MDWLVAKETTKSRKSRDNSDEGKLFETLTNFKDLTENTYNLINIAINYVATTEIQESLLTAKENGEKIMLEFVKRISEQEETIPAEEFYTNIERNNVKTFNDLYLICVNCIPQHVLETLILFHTFTGCDTTSFIANHTKTSAWTDLLSHSHLIRNLGAFPLQESDYNKI